MMLKDSTLSNSHCEITKNSPLKNYLDPHMNNIPMLLVTKCNGLWADTVNEVLKNETTS